MKRVITVLGVVVLLATTSFEAKSQLGTIVPTIVEAIRNVCVTGGPGSTSCSLSVEIGADVAGSGGSVSVTYSQSCGPGYYSCCSLYGGSCKRNE